MKRYLTAADLIRINDRMTRRWGGMAGVRNRGILESAVGRLQSGYYTNVIEEAAALCESLLQNHPFLDGNKRPAIVATAVFLRWNGYKLQFCDREMYDWLMSPYDAGSIDKHAIDEWLRTHITEPQ